MTAPEKAIIATEEALKVSGSTLEMSRTLNQMLLERVLMNQLLLLRATKVHLSWSDEE